ncbi:cysteine proteinase [Periconia macrospinosa]|uniref:Cysteine proteinase n=1 Tax=Periconia macrospinosa TaxID=97972 RepID=A0A2V1DMP6_9PLEO|nr:cysteine proteinase [Periconia macrospinosa]
MNKFWDEHVNKTPSKITNIFPPSLYANLLPPKQKPGAKTGNSVLASYEAARDECRARVKRIRQECLRTNEKFTDPDFDIELDWRCKVKNYLYHTGDDKVPGSVHRVDWIFEKPSFTIDGFSGSDVKQGLNNDCWFLAALSSACSKPSLLEKICVDRDEACGVYGFVFYRDGEWISTVIDDNLYLTNEDFSGKYDPIGEKHRKYKKKYQTNSDALLFAHCENENETWAPLIEKAYAKVHGDFKSIETGFSGEGVEDITGGVNTAIMTHSVLNKDKLWEELLNVNQDFLFSATSNSGTDSERQGIALNHAYSFVKAVEEKDEKGQAHRLILIRNPWGRRYDAATGEWNGPWSDGSKEWTPYWMEKLGHKFGDDGTFWMSYEQVLNHFPNLHRTRLFNENWYMVQHWTSVDVAWVTGYLNTKFVVEIKKAGPTVFVLSQLDERYFAGLEGRFTFGLHFVLQSKNGEDRDDIIRVRGSALSGRRSVSTEIHLEPGVYEVLPKITAGMDDKKDEVYKVVTSLAKQNPQKLRQIGRNYDYAHAKVKRDLATTKEHDKEKKTTTSDEESSGEKKPESSSVDESQEEKPTTSDSSNDAEKKPASDERDDATETTPGSDEGGHVPEKEATTSNDKKDAAEENEPASNQGEEARETTTTTTSAADPRKPSPKSKKQNHSSSPSSSKHSSSSSKSKKDLAFEKELDIRAKLMKKWVKEEELYRRAKKQGANNNNNYNKKKRSTTTTTSSSDKKLLQNQQRQEEDEDDDDDDDEDEGSPQQPILPTKPPSSIHDNTTVAVAEEHDEKDDDAATSSDEDSTVLVATPNTPTTESDRSSSSSSSSSSSVLKHEGEAAAAGGREPRAAAPTITKTNKNAAPIIPRPSSPTSSESSSSESSSPDSDSSDSDSSSYAAAPPPHSHHHRHSHCCSHCSHHHRRHRHYCKHSSSHKHSSSSSKKHSCSCCSHKKNSHTTSPPSPQPPAPAPLIDPPPPPPPPPAAPSTTDVEGGQGEGERKAEVDMNAWNAVCSVGLLVFSMDEGVTVGLAR